MNEAELIRKTGDVLKVVHLEGESDSEYTSRVVDALKAVRETWRECQRLNAQTPTAGYVWDATYDAEGALETLIIQPVTPKDARRVRLGRKGVETLQVALSGKAAYDAHRMASANKFWDGQIEDMRRAQEIMDQAMKGTPS